MARSRGKPTENIHRFTAVHGLQSLETRKPLSSAKNVVFICVFLAGLAGFITHAGLLLHSYLQYRRIAEIEVKPANINEFPAVTMCSLNPFKKSKTHLVKELNNIQAAYNYAVQKVKAEAELTHAVRKRRQTRKVELAGENTALGKGKRSSDSNEHQVDNRSRMKRVSAVSEYNWEYVGCSYGHESYDAFGVGTGRLLRGKYNHGDSDRMMQDSLGGATSVESCISFCRGHRYAAIEGGWGCSCGEELKFDMFVPDSECNQVCQDSAKLQATCAEYGCPTDCAQQQCCGSGGRASVYEAKTFPNAGEFVACLIDYDPRLLADRSNYDSTIQYSYTIVDQSLAFADVNINTCMEYCRDYEYMGINDARYCSCADTIKNQPTALDPSQCTIPCDAGGLKSDCAHFGCDRDECAGDTQCCGGTQKAAVYKTQRCNIALPLVAVDGDNNKFVGETVELDCEGNYSLEPPGLRVCNSSKQLDPTPSCKPWCLVTFHEIPFGYALTGANYLSFGTQVHFQCLDQNLYQMLGESVTECVDDGLWSNPPPECVASNFTETSTLPVEFDINDLNPAQEAVYRSMTDRYELEWTNVTGPAPFRLTSLELQARSSMQGVVRDIPNELLWNITASAAELLRLCRYNGEPCTPLNFKSIPHPIYGRCHIFTKNDSATELKYSQKRGLQAAIFNEPQEDLLTSDTKGGRLILHDIKDYPFPEVSGVSVASGFHYIISFSKHVVNYLPGSCQPGDQSFESIYPQDYEYSEEICFRTCAAKYTYVTCGCTDRRYPYPQDAVNVTSCLEQDQCYKTAMLRSVNACDGCRKKCRLVHYPVTITATAWPLASSFPHMKELCANSVNKEQCIGEIRNNIMLLEIFPNLAQYEEHTEKLVKTLGQLFNDCSNALGIWIGLGYVGIIEIGYVLSVLLRKCMVKSKNM